MAVRPLEGVLHCLRQAVLAVEGEGPTDGELLERYRSGREEAAFEALVRRHAPMIWGVCRRILGNVHDAEDAFQAVFLVLVRKAASIRPAQRVGSWLHGVAYRTAMNARAARARRNLRETQNDRLEPAARTIQPLEHHLDEELERLPEKYRAVLVLCDLEGKTRREAARQLGCPEGTVAGRLARARVLLAKRLKGNGLAVSGAALALELARSSASAAPAGLVHGTIKAAAAFTLASTVGGVSVGVLTLTKGVLKAMFLEKLKPAMLLLAVAVAGLTGAVTGVLPLRTVVAAEPEEGPLPQLPTRAAETVKAPTDRDPALPGTWVLERVLRDGKTLTVAPGSLKLIVTNRYMIWQGRDSERVFAYKLNTARNPKHIDLILLEPGQTKTARTLGVYAILADRLVIHASDGLRPRDASFQGTMGTTVCIYRRLGAISPASAASTPMLPDAGGAWANKLFTVVGAATSHDFGKRYRGTQLVCAFPLKNIYSVPVDISHTRVSCGCVSVSTSRKRLEPNEEGQIVVRVDTRRFSGPKTFAVYVTMFSKEYISTATLRVSADSQDGQAPVKSSKQRFRGKIVRVDEKKRLLEVDLGTDQGLAKNQVLWVYRLRPRPQYLGELRIIDAAAGRAVGRVANLPAGALVRVGDEVGDVFDEP